MINVRDNRLEFYDSSHGTGGIDEGFAELVLANLERWVQDESLDKRKEQLCTDGWTRHVPSNVPQQENGFDCGMFAFKFAQCVSLDLKVEDLAPLQPHMEAFRKCAIVQMINGTLK